MRKERVVEIHEGTENEFARSHPRPQQMGALGLNIYQEMNGYR